MKKLFGLYAMVSILYTIYDSWYFGIWTVVGHLMLCVVQFALILSVYGFLKGLSQPYINSSTPDAANHMSSQQTNSKPKTTTKPKKKYYNCPRCGRTLDHPGTCSGMCSGDGRGVFRL